MLKDELWIKCKQGMFIIEYSGSSSRTELMLWVQRFAFLTSTKDPDIYVSHQFGAKVKQETAVPPALPESLHWLSLTLTAAERCVPLPVTNQRANNSSYSLLTMEDMNWRHSVQIKGHKQFISSGFSLYAFNRFFLKHAKESLSHGGYVKCLFSAHSLPGRTWNPMEVNPEFHSASH